MNDYTRYQAWIFNNKSKQWEPIGKLCNTRDEAVQYCYWADEAALPEGVSSMTSEVLTLL